MISLSKKLIYTSFYILATFLVVFLLSSLFIQSPKEILAQTADSDAIAIRVIRNTDGYSAARWYKNKNFTGSPQAIEVDGYRGIRDGRTAYVNVANISGTSFYTNIYVISYNQQADVSTVDIFSQILNNWKFNTNLEERGTCSESGDTCVLNDDCSIDEVCVSEKMSVVRDTRRLADIREIESLLEEFYDKYDYYPQLNSGSYLPHISISVWPSWQNVLAQMLGGSVPVDPINRLGDCGNERFNPQTCWDERSQEFADAGYSAPTDDADLPNINLPANSRAYIYRTSPNGGNFSLYAAPESPYAPVSTGSGSSGNADPIIVHANVPPGYSGEPYSASFEIRDPNPADILTVTIGGVGGLAGSGWQDVGTDMIALPNNQWMFRAGMVGNEGDYNISINVDDGSGGSARGNYTIHIVNTPPKISVADYEFPVSRVNNAMRFRGTVYDDNINQYPLTVSTSHNSSNRMPGYTPILNGPDTPYSKDSPDNYIYELFYIGRPAYGSVPETISRTYTITATDRAGATSEAQYTITLINNPPVIATDPVYTAVVGSADFVTNEVYIRVSDPEDNDLENPFTLVNTTAGIDFPTGLLHGHVDNNTYFITGMAQDDTPDQKDWPNSLVVTDIFGAVSRKDFTIRIINNPPSFSVNDCAKEGVIGQAYTSCHLVAIDPDNHNIREWSVAGVGGLSMVNQAGRSADLQGTLGSSGNYGVTITATDAYGAQGVERFTLSVRNNPPVIHSINCPHDTAINQPYNCNLATAMNASDPDPGHVIAGIEVISGPAWLTIDNIADRIFGTPNTEGTYTIRVVAYDQYGAASEPYEFEISVTMTFCGDGTQQIPNGRGDGVNDGNEECDDGVANNGPLRSCDTDCSRTFCGDGIRQSPSVAGGAVNGDGLNEDCDGMDGACSTDTECASDCLCRCIICTFDVSNFGDCCLR